MAISPGLCVVGGGKNHQFPNLSLKGVYVHMLKAAALGSGFYFRTHLGTSCASWRQEPVGHLLCYSLSLQPLKVATVTMERAYMHICAQLLRCCLWDGPLDCLALIANRACIHESYRIVTNKEAVLNGHRSTP